jgi:hypothetical protein
MYLVLGYVLINCVYWYAGLSKHLLPYGTCAEFITRIKASYVHDVVERNTTEHFFVAAWVSMRVLLLTLWIKRVMHMTW